MRPRGLIFSRNFPCPRSHLVPFGAHPIFDFQMFTVMDPGFRSLELLAAYLSYQWVFKDIPATVGFVKILCDMMYHLNHGRFREPFLATRVSCRTRRVSRCSDVHMEQ